MEQIIISIGRHEMFLPIIQLRRINCFYYESLLYSVFRLYIDSTVRIFQQCTAAYWAETDRLHCTDSNNLRCEGNFFFFCSRPFFFEHDFLHKLSYM